MSPKGSHSEVVGPSWWSSGKVTETSGDFRAELEEVGQRRQASQGLYLGPSFLCFLATMSWRTWFYHILLPCTDSETAQHRPRISGTSQPATEAFETRSQNKFLSPLCSSQVLCHSHRKLTHPVNSADSLATVQKLWPRALPFSWWQMLGKEIEVMTWELKSEATAGTFPTKRANNTQKQLRK